MNHKYRLDTCTQCARTKTTKWYSGAICHACQEKNRLIALPIKILQCKNCGLVEAKYLTAGRCGSCEGKRKRANKSIMTCTACNETKKSVSTLGMCEKCYSAHNRIVKPEIFTKSIEKNKSKHSEAVRAWASTNLPKRAAIACKGRAIKKKRIPQWLTNLHFDQIEIFYDAASRLTEELGIPMEVDHIIPLKGKNVSGLHVPWNLQVISGSENARKSNKFDGTRDNLYWSE